MFMPRGSAGHRFPLRLQVELTRILWPGARGEVEIAVTFVTNFSGQLAHAGANHSAVAAAECASIDDRSGPFGNPFDHADFVEVADGLQHWGLTARQYTITPG